MIFWTFSFVHISVQREEKTKIKKRLQFGEHVTSKIRNVKLFIELTLLDQLEKVNSFVESQTIFTQSCTATKHLT